MHNQKLRKARLQKRWSIEKAAEKVGVSWLTFSRWEHGTQQPHPTTLDMLCDAFGMSPEALGFTDEGIERDTESEEEMKRREALQKIAEKTGTILALSNGLWRSSSTRDIEQYIFKSDLSGDALASLATISQQYRILQRNGNAMLEHGIHGHISTIQNALESTVSDKIRRDLWRLLAQAQLLARLNVTKKHELGRAKTWNEATIASAQQSGDTTLLGAAIGHLAYLYLMDANDIATAYQLIERSQELAQAHMALNGWLTIVTAAIAAKAGNEQECKRAIARATESAAALASKDADAFFTDFSMVGVDALAGNCYLTIGEPVEAYKRLTAMNLRALSENRHASAYYDLSRAYAAAGELGAMQTYAFQSIDKALATNRLYIVPRFIKLAHEIQIKDKSESHAATIAEYAQVALGRN